MTEAWYEAVEAETRLTQGDLICECPVITWKAGPVKIEGSKETEILKSASDTILADVVVMTQACDLKYDKVSNVVLCPHVSLAEFRAAWEEDMRRRRQNPTEGAWKTYCHDITDGFLWNLTILNECNAAKLHMDHRIVDFHDIFTVPRDFLESLLQQRGNRRLRLLPPYREHLSQAFARYFMRVGLPVPITPAW